MKITRETKRAGEAHQLLWLLGLNFLVDDVMVRHCELTLDWFVLTSQRLTQILSCPPLIARLFHETARLLGVPHVACGTTDNVHSNQYE